MSELSNAIHALDVRQTGPKAAICGADPTHGRLTVHGSSRAFVCAVKTGPKEYCDFTMAIDAATVAEALAEV